MSDSIIYSDINTFYKKGIIEEDTKKNRDEKLKIIKILFYILLAVIIIEAFLYAFVMPCLVPVKVSITGLETLNENQVIKYLDISSKTTWIQFDSGKAVQKLNRNAIIQQVHIEKHFPDRVIVSIVERKAVAVSLATVNGKVVPVQIDKNGVIYAINRGMPNGNIPLVTGFVFENLEEGTRLHSKLCFLMEQIAKIQETNPEYFSALSEIRVLPKDYGTYELALYPIHSKTRVLTDKNLTVETLQYMMVTLDVIESFDTNVSEVDMRYGSVSYKKSKR